MKRIDTYITEKFKINKNTSLKQIDLDLLSYGEFLHKLSNDIEGLPLSIADEMISSKCFPNVKVKNYDYFFVDPEKNKDNYRYKYYINRLGPALVKNPDHEELTLKRLYIDNIIHLYVYHYENVNLSDDAGDEHYIVFLDDIKHKVYMYEFIEHKTGSRYIKKLK